MNLADDAELLGLMRAANFFGIFIGIESPDTDTLVAMQKKQNTRRSLVDSVHKLYASGLVGDRRLHRRLRQRAGKRRQADDRLHRGDEHPSVHGRPF